MLITLTADGSHSILDTKLNVSYHSRHGAIRESLHVFINAGLSQLTRKHISILEMGFGTALNALLTFMHTPGPQSPSIYYVAIDNTPLEFSVVDQLNYCNQLKRPDLQEAFLKMHRSQWNSPASISGKFTLLKHLLDLRSIQLSQKFHLVYFDAFDPLAQPELWTTEIFSKIREHMEDGGILVTYCSKSSVQRSLRDAGFEVEKIPGPPGKREIIRAFAR